MQDDVITPWRNEPIRAGLPLDLTDVRITLEEISFLVASGGSGHRCNHL